MASLAPDKSGNYLVTFRWEGRQRKRSLHTRDATIAQAGLAKVKETIRLLNAGIFKMPPGADPITFIMTGGQLTSKPVAESEPIRNTLGRLFETYRVGLTPGAKEPNSL